MIVVALCQILCAWKENMSPDILYIGVCSCLRSLWLAKRVAGRRGQRSRTTELYSASTVNAMNALIRKLALLAKLYLVL